MKWIYPIILTLISTLSFASKDSIQIYWKITNRNSILWNLTTETRLPHSDNIEMAGRKVAAIIFYSVDKNKKLSITRQVFYPQLRTYILPNQPWWKHYRAYFKHLFNDNLIPTIILNQHKIIPQQVDSIEINGKIIFYHKPLAGIKITRTIFPSMSHRLLIEKWTIQNVTDSALTLKIFSPKYQYSEQGYKGLYKIAVYSDAPNELILSPNQAKAFAIYFAAALNNKDLYNFSWQEAEKQRDSFLTIIRDNFVLKTPDPVINQLFYFSKIRAAENLFDSKMGIIHSPGGGNYYVGIWANDQAEYSGPFFPYLGYELGNQAAYNCYKWFDLHKPDNYDSPITSSFEMDADLTCCGLDRGDAAMIAYGASLFALLRGNKQIAQDIWSLISWALEYNHRHRNEAGVVISDTDEMEGRLPTGNANLATSVLYYGGLIYGARLANALGKYDTAKLYLERAKQLKQAIENYFGADIQGLKTYRYFEGYDKLRHWICLPLVMGIFDRKEGTLKALFDKMWTENGILVEYPWSGEDVIFWDRATLYAFRGAFKAGAADLAIERLEQFSKNRLLGPHVPYVVEAYPENNMRHLSAESALYCRIFPEGILGMEPLSFSSFKIAPNIPQKWNYFELSHIRAFNSDFSLKVKRLDSLNLMVDIWVLNRKLMSKKIKQGEEIVVKL